MQVKVNAILNVREISVTTNCPSGLPNVFVKADLFLGNNINNRTAVTFSMPVSDKTLDPLFEVLKQNCMEIIEKENK